MLLAIARCERQRMKQVGPATPMPTGPQCRENVVLPDSGDDAHLPCSHEQPTTKSLARPVIANLRTLRHLTGRRVTADRTPDLRLELAGCNIIAGIVVVYSSQSQSIPRTSSLTAVEAAGPFDLIRVAVSKSTADASSVAPHHLREVAPGVVVVRLVVRVLGLLLVPAVRGSAGELDPVIVAGGRRLLGGEVAARTHLCMSARSHPPTAQDLTHVLGQVAALGDVTASSIGKALVPDQVLSAVEATPVPVSPHHSTDEVGVIRVRSVIVDEVAGLDLVRGRSNRSGSQQSGECSERLHVDVVHRKERPGCRDEFGESSGRRRVGAVDRGCCALR